MTDSFLLNQEVTATMLNDVAIDLGAASFSKFQNGVETAVSELNGITQELTSRGVLRSGNQCEPSYSNGAVSVATGVVVFETGAKRKLTENIAIEIPSSDTHYVYFENDHNLNEIFLRASTDAPDTNSDTVMIATVQNSVCNDAREWSTPKVTMASGEGAHSGEEITCTFTEAELFAVDVGEEIKRFSLKSSTYSTVSFYRVGLYDSWYGLSDLGSGFYAQRYGSSGRTVSQGSPNEFKIVIYKSSSNEVTVTAKVEDGSIVFYRTSSSTSGMSFTFKFQ